jgi:ribonuclease D
MHLNKESIMAIHLHLNDLPESVNAPSVAIDTEAMGLNIHRDRLCVVQLKWDNDVHLVQMMPNHDSLKNSPHLQALLGNVSILKLFHYGRFDMAGLYHSIGVMPKNIYCTKIASKLVRTYTDRHSLKELCKVLLGVEISKEEQTSDWGQSLLTEEQKKYAAQDVLHLHALKEKLDELLKREGRMELAQSCFDYLSTRVLFDLMVGEDYDIFSHKG